jgi:predicted nucleotidyltransferase
MEFQIKKAVKAGNSSAVILPRSWLNKEVRIELLKKTPEIILSNVLHVIKNNMDLKDVIGIYLTGSYARDEEDENSDIDILVVTKDVDKEMIYEGIYNILVISSELIAQKLERDIFPIGQMLREAKPILNANYLDSIKIQVTEKNANWYIKTTKDKLEIIRKVLDLATQKNKKDVDDIIAYTLILRIRTLYIIKKLMKNEPYSKKEFIKILRRISGGTGAYEGYLAVKNNSEEKKKTNILEAEKLYDYLKSELLKIKNSLKEFSPTKS